jgi:hypothetical protein
VPADGSVDGWRYAVADVDSTRYPRAVLTFEQICGSTPAQAGKKRVGRGLDFGRPADAAEGAADGATPPEPKALCAVVAADASSDAVLAAAGGVRTEKGLVCSVAGYPAKDCGGPVKQVSAEAKAADQAVTIAAPASTPTAATPSAGGTDVAAAPATTSASSGGSSAAYIVAAIVLLALIGYLVVRSRSRARQDG